MRPISDANDCCKQITKKRKGKRRKEKTLTANCWHEATEPSRHTRVIHPKPNELMLHATHIMPHRRCQVHFVASCANFYEFCCRLHDWLNVLSLFLSLCSKVEIETCWLFCFRFAIVDVTICHNRHVFATVLHKQTHTHTQRVATYANTWTQPTKGCFHL